LKVACFRRLGFFWLFAPMSKSGCVSRRVLPFKSPQGRCSDTRLRSLDRPPKGAVRSKLMLFRVAGEGGADNTSRGAWVGEIVRVRHTAGENSPPPSRGCTIPSRKPRSELQPPTAPSSTSAPRSWTLAARWRAAAAPSSWPPSSPVPPPTREERERFRRSHTFFPFQREPCTNKGARSCRRGDSETASAGDDLSCSARRATAAANAEACAVARYTLGYA
jgi:hypothetical protein